MNISELIKRNFVDKNLYRANRMSNVQVVDTSNFVKVNSQLCSDTFNVGIILDEHRHYELLFKEVVCSFNKGTLCPCGAGRNPEDSRTSWSIRI